ncbi:hypothetical protein ABB29_05310 [Pseudoxanthomonas dokdonensis]|uniref:N-formylglutamate amidohydrolase n=1 Tax=Pseudoxanthomonas dokdonensis TaxID=344882 RepID=A0A0R0CM82_9GAMM|nr:hypothetical protein ABB29_05310 [Pseudoxanthomonas dokdonensis]
MPDWDLVIGHGPVLVTAIHDGHAIRNSLLPHLAIDEASRRREEDPMTAALTRAGDVRLVARQSRFQVDLNRPRHKCISSDPADTWGLQIWKPGLPGAELDASMREHDQFYTLVRALIDALLKQWGKVLLVDVHSYNHRRDGPQGPVAPMLGNPDIELGVTTLDRTRWGSVAKRFADVLRDHPINDAKPDVRENIRFPTGGYFPEWVYATYGDKVCTISPEYKKIFMDEWTGKLDIAALEHCRDGLQHAIDAVRPEFLA